MRLERVGSVGCGVAPSLRICRCIAWAAVCRVDHIHEEPERSVNQCKPLYPMNLAVFWNRLGCVLCTRVLSRLLLLPRGTHRVTMVIPLRGVVTKASNVGSTVVVSSKVVDLLYCHATCVLLANFSTRPHVFGQVGPHQSDRSSRSGKPIGAPCECEPLT